MLSSSCEGGGCPSVFLSSCCPSLLDPPSLVSLSWELPAPPPLSAAGPALGCRPGPAEPPASPGSPIDCLTWLSSVLRYPLPPHHCTTARHHSHAAAEGSSMVTGSAGLPWSLHDSSPAPQGTCGRRHMLTEARTSWKRRGISEVLRSCKYLNLLPSYCKGLIDKYSLYSASNKE